MKHYTPIQIRFHDIDQLGHVNNANYLTYFEVARMAYFKTLVKKEIDWESTGLILANTSVVSVAHCGCAHCLFAGCGRHRWDHHGVRVVRCC